MGIKSFRTSFSAPTTAVYVINPTCRLKLTNTYTPPFSLGGNGAQIGLEAVLGTMCLEILILWIVAWSWLRGAINLESINRTCDCSLQKPLVYAFLMHRDEHLQQQ